MMEKFWVEVNESSLRQGDWIANCTVPVFRREIATSNQPQDFRALEYDVVITTQSCDLEQKRARLVACVPIFAVAAFEVKNPAFAKKGRWNEVPKGRVEGLHLLASPTSPEDNRQAMVIDFREIYSLPFEYLVSRAVEIGPRWRMRSPFLEHFSQAFARFFMRVGLPSTIPEYH